MMKVMASTINGLSGNKALTSLFITFFVYFLIDLSDLMSAKVTCNICNESGSSRNLIKCSLCLKMVYLKCNNLNVFDAEL